MAKQALSSLDSVSISARLTGSSYLHAMVTGCRNWGCDLSHRSENDELRP